MAPCSCFSAASRARIGWAGSSSSLWARFELTEEEDALIKKYQVRNALVTLGNTRRDIRLAALYALPVPFLVYLIFSSIYGFGGVCLSRFCFMV